MKTTNAKAKAFQTPAPLTIDNRIEKTIQKTSPRLRRPKVKIHQPEPVTQEESEEEPEIEHVPPKEVPLPDIPSDDEELGFGPNKTFPQFEGANYTRGYPSIYFNPFLPNGETYLERKAREKNEKYEAEFEAEAEKLQQDELKETEARLRIELGLSPVKKSTTAPVKQSGVKPLSSKSVNPVGPKKTATSALSSRAAAAALAAPTKSSSARQILPSSTSRATAPSSHTRINRKAQPAGQKAQHQATSKPGKHATASTAARSTLGYSKGRAAVSSLRAPPSPVLETSRDEGISSALASLGLGNEDDELFGSYTAGGEDHDDDEDDEIFQLTLGV